MSSTSSSLKSAWTAVTERAKAHHESVQGAYEVYYGAGTRNPIPRQSTSSSRSPAVSSSASSIMSKATSASDKESSVSLLTKSPATSKPSTWSRIKQHAREHHESVNAAYEVYYGGGVIRR